MATPTYCPSTSVIVSLRDFSFNSYPRRRIAARVDYPQLTVTLRIHHRNAAAWAARAFCPHRCGCSGFVPGTISRCAWTFKFVFLLVRLSPRLAMFSICNQRGFSVAQVSCSILPGVFVWIKVMFCSFRRGDCNYSTILSAFIILVVFKCACTCVRWRSRIIK